MRIKRKQRKSSKGIFAFALAFAALLCGAGTLASVNAEEVACTGSGTAATGTATLKVSFENDEAKTKGTVCYMDANGTWQTVDASAISADGYAATAVKIVSDYDLASYSGLRLDGNLVENFTANVKTETGVSLEAGKTYDLEHIDFVSNSGSEEAKPLSVVAIWSCEKGTCVSSPFEITNGRATGWPTDYFLNTTVTDIDDPTYVFDPAAEKIGLAYANKRESWSGLASTDIDTLLSGDNRVDINPLSAKSSENSYANFGDNDFKAVIYTNAYVGATFGSLTSLTYQPDFWTASIYQESFDISESTAENPAQMEALLVQNELNLKSNGQNGVVFKSVEALDTPTAAITITESETETGTFKITFNSNYYNKTVFEITDTNNNKYYIRIARITAVVSDTAGPGNLGANVDVIARVYYTESMSAKDLEVTAALVYEDGSVEQVAATALTSFSDAMGNPVTPDSAAGTGLKYAAWKVDNKENVVGVTFNVRYIGSTPEEYAGTFAGADLGIYYDINARAVDYTK